MAVGSARDTDLGRFAVHRLNGGDISGVTSWCEFSKTFEEIDTIINI